MQDDLFGGVGIKVDILQYENFLKIKETLTRIGVVSNTSNSLFQTCHILHKRDVQGTSHYAVVHFKEMFKLDGKPSSIDRKDYQRRNKIAELLQQWNLIEIIDNDKDDLLQDTCSMRDIKVISNKDKHNWNLIPKYEIGKK